MLKRSMQEKVYWDWEIKKETSWFGASFKELFQYKDLLFRLARKDFLGSYQQTLLGPFWVLFQPLLTVITFVLVFNKVIGISTGKVPPLLFNLFGITLWNLFSEIFFKISNTFIQNGQVFSKVYFPRIIVALSALWLQLLLFGIQLILLTGVFLYYSLTGQIKMDISHVYMIVPTILVTTGIGFGSGLIFSVLTAKYRDLLALMQLIIRLLMFVCPIFYSLAIIPQNLKWIVNINPLSVQFELFRFAFLGSGSIKLWQCTYSAVSMLFLVFFGIMLFNKMSDKLMDVL